MTGQFSVFQLGILNQGKRCGSLFTACKEIWVQGSPAADISTVTELSLLSSRKMHLHTLNVSNQIHLSCRVYSARTGERTFVWCVCFLADLLKALEAPPYSVSTTSPLPLSSLWHQHKYYPNQRRKFFLNSDDKDIHKIYGNDFLWNGIQT